MTLLLIPNLRGELGLAPEDDHELATILAEVTLLWEKATGRPWVKNTAAVEQFMPPNRRSHYLWLPLIPVVTVTKVEQRQLDESVWTTLDAAEYFLSDATLGRIEKLKTPWLPHVQVTYDGGVTTAVGDPNPVPEDIQRALIIQIRYMRQRTTDEVLTKRGISGKGGRVEFLERADYHPLFTRIAKLHRRR